VHNSAMNRGTPHRNVHRIATFGVPAVPPFPRTSVRVRTLLRSPPRVWCGKVPKPQGGGLLWYGYGIFFIY
jgi:hypothetical protein